MFSERLKILRESNDYSMDKLVQKYNDRFNGKMNKSTLSRYENNLQEPIYTVVVNLSKLFNVSVDYLLGETDDPRTSAQILEDSIKNRKGKILAHGGNGTMYVDDVADAYYRNFPNEAPKDRYFICGGNETIDITKEEFEKLKSLLYTILRG